MNLGASTRPEPASPLSELEMPFPTRPQLRGCPQLLIICCRPLCSLLPDLASPPAPGSRKEINPGAPWERRQIACAPLARQTPKDESTSGAAGAEPPAPVPPRPCTFGNPPWAFLMDCKDPKTQPGPSSHPGAPSPPVERNQDTALAK